MQLDATELLRYLRVMVCFSMLAVSTSYMCAVFSDRKWSIRLFRGVLTYHIILMFTGILSNQNTTVMPVVTFACYWLFLFYYCKLRGMALFKAAFFGTAFSAAGDILTGLCTMYLYHFDMDTIELARLGYTPICYITNLTCVFFTIFLTACYFFLTSSKKQHPSYENLFRVFRPLVMAICLLTLFLRTMQHSESLGYTVRFMEIFPEFLVIVILFCLGGSYAIQDIKYLRQNQLNSRLLQQKEEQDALLKETRVFRHNIANLLYGFQGILLSDDKQAVQEYYGNLVDTCALVNNENVVSLQRIPSLAVSSLLLNKIQGANEKKIPFYLYTDDGLNYHGLKDKEMCEILGILLDNALEGAAESPAPLITVEFHNAQTDMEIVVRNTFGEEAANLRQDDILFSTVSSKAGHMGIGVSSVRSLLSGSRSVFNIYMRGRYIEASLLLNS